MIATPTTTDSVEPATLWPDCHPGKHATLRLHTADLVRLACDWCAPPAPDSAVRVEVLPDVAATETELIDVINSLMIKRDAARQYGYHLGARELHAAAVAIAGLFNGSRTVADLTDFAVAALAAELADVRAVCP